MPPRNVVLTNHQQSYVEELVKSGQYQNASEVLREGLRLVEQRDREEQLKLEALRQAAEVGWRDISDGHYVDLGVQDIEVFVADIGHEVSRKFSGV